MQAITPYLNFPGTAAQALDLYRRALNGNTEMVQYYRDMPPQEGMEPMPEDAILHATFRAGELMLMASDMPKDMKTQPGNNVSLSMNFDDAAVMENVFNALAEGGTATMPLQDTFWGARFGMLTDRFGINWMFNHDYPNGQDHNFPV